MTLGQRLGFTSILTLGLLASSVAALLAFLWVERTTRSPMVDLTLLEKPDFSLNLFTGFLTFVAIAAVIFLLPFYLELVMGLDQREVGLLMAVVPIVLGVLGPLAGALSDRYGTRPISLIGLTLLLIGYLALTHLSTTSQPIDYILLLLPVGMGMGIFQSPNNSAIMSAVPRARLGIASGLLSMTRTLGQTTGIAILGAFFASRLQTYAGQPVDINMANPADIVRALGDQFHVAAGLIAVGLSIALWRAWRERKK